METETTETTEVATEVAPVETKVETEVAPVETEAEKTEEKAEEKPKKNKVTARERIAQLTKRRGDAEKEVDRLRQENEQLKNSQKLTKPPSEDDFSTYESYSEQKKKWDTQTEQERLAEIDRLAEVKIAKREQEKEALKRVTTYSEKKKEALAKYEEFQDSEDYVVTISNYYKNPSIQTMIMESKNPTALIDWMGNNHKKAEELVRSSLVSAARTIAELETQLVKAPVKAKDLPPPADKPKAGGSSVFNPFTATQAEYNRYVNGGGKITVTKS